MYEEFKASNGWLYRLKKKYQINVGTRTSGTFKLKGVDFDTKK